MTLITSSELATTLKVSKARVSQYVSEGKLGGCYSGDGRARRFDLGKVAIALGRQLHPGQMLGNGAATRRVLADLPLMDEGDDDASIVKTSARDGGALTSGDPSRYELAKIQKAEEEARKLRRQNAEAEGLYTLSAEVALQTARLIGQEIAEFETVLRDGARRVADKLGVDFKVVRQLLVEEWRAKRAGRAVQLEAAAEIAELSEIERAGDI